MGGRVQGSLGQFSPALGGESLTVRPTILLNQCLPCIATDRVFRCSGNQIIEAPCAVMCTPQDRVSAQAQ